MAIDSILLVGFGGPEAPEDVHPFLRNVTKGRNIPEERLDAVAEQYMAFGGISPINGQHRSLLASMRQELDLPVYWGNRNWQPFLADAVEEMKADGHKHGLAFVTSAYSSYSGCRQYREDLTRAQESVGEGAPRIDKIRQYFDHPLFIEVMADRVREVLPADPSNHRLVFTAHSVPVSMAKKCRYEVQLSRVASLVTAAAGNPCDWDVAWQSRSGPPQVPWLGPDINDHLVSLTKQHLSGVTVVPIGFVFDHMEVLFDLDTQAAKTAATLGLGFTRASTAGTDPRFVTMIRELVDEQLDPSKPRRALGAQPTTCLGSSCCLSA